ncbi:MAG: transglutaminase family protein [Caldilineaceae bacterium]
MASPPELPEWTSTDLWRAVDALAADVDFWDDLAPSHFVQFTPSLIALAEELHVDRTLDPLSMLRHINTGVYYTFQYVPDATTVIRPLTWPWPSAAASRRITHTSRWRCCAALGIPARYVSGYLFHRREDHDQSAEDASHAWIEAYLPTLGWIGLDPTNNLLRR